MSMAFLSAAGTERLCSGVTNSTASAALIRCRNAVRSGGGLESRSWLNSGNCAISTISSSSEAGATPMRACAIMRLREPLRILPTMTATLRAVMAVHPSTAVGTVFGDGGEVIDRQDHHGVALQAHPFLVFPDAQLLVDAFARHPDDVAEIFLGDRDLAFPHSGRIGVGEAHECLGETARQVEEHDFRRLLGGPA